MKNLIYDGFKKSYAWREYFKALFDAIKSGNSKSFKALFTKPEGEFALSDFTVCFTEEGTALAYIDTKRKVIIEGALLRHPEQLAEVEGYTPQWLTSLNPLNGILEVKSSKSFNTLKVKIEGDEADFIKLHQNFQVNKTNLNSKYPPILTKKKLSSLALFKRAMQDLGAGYDVEMNPSQSESFVAEDAINILEISGNEAFYRTQFIIEVGDKVGEATVTSVNEKSLTFDGLLKSGWNSVTFNSRRWAPLLSERTGSIQIILDERTKKNEVKRLFEREKPFRLKGKVLYIDLALEAVIDLNANLTLDRKPLIATFDPLHPDKRIQDVWIDWKVGSSVPILVGVKNADWKTEPKWWISGIDNHGDKYTVQVEPNKHTSQIAEVTFKMLQSNRQSQEFIVEVEFETIPNKTSDVEAEPYKHVVRVHIKPWDPEIFEVSICETLGVHAGKQENEPLDIYDNLDTQSKNTDQKPLDIQDSLGVAKEVPEQTPLDVWDKVMFDSDQGEIDVLTITPTLKNIDCRGTEELFLITSTRRDWVVFVKEGI